MAAKKSKTLAQEIALGHVSLKTAAKMIGISYPTITKMANRVEILTLRVGAQRRVAVSEVDRFLKEGNFKPEASPEAQIQAQSEQKSAEAAAGDNIPAYLAHLKGMKV